MRLWMDERETMLHEYQDRMRKERIVQVRFQENVFSSHQVKKLKEKKRKKQEALLLHLKEAWKETQKERIAELELKCSIALQNIGASHAAAATLMSRQIANEQFFEKFDQENQLLEAARYKEALLQEQIKKEQAEEADRFAHKRKKTKEVAACLERSLSRFASHSLGKRFKKEKCYTTASYGWKEVPPQPSAYKHTFLHCLVPLPKVAEDCNVNAEKDAWDAAEIQKQTLNYNKELHAEVAEVLRRRIALRGQAAASRMLMNKRIQQLERELAMVLKAETENKQRLLLSSKLKEEHNVEDEANQEEENSAENIPALKDAAVSPILFPQPKSSCRSISGIDGVVKSSGLRVTPYKSGDCTEVPGDCTDLKKEKKKRIKEVKAKARRGIEDAKQKNKEKKERDETCAKLAKLSPMDLNTAEASDLLLRESLTKMKQQTRLKRKK